MGDLANSNKKGFNDGFWSKKEIRETVLEEQRQYIWNEDYFGKILVPLFKLKRDSVVLDVGCGLGFLGGKLGEFVPEGKVIGVDLDLKLVETARKRIVNNANSKIFDFRVGDVCDLAIESDYVDLAICQTLLMHLEDPAKAIAEMKRVTKRGGTVAAIEPNYASQSFFDTAYETMKPSIDDRTRMWRWNAILDAGKKKLGRGENEIGPKVSYLFFKSGLRVVDVRTLDRVFWLIPPYEGRELEIKHLLIPPERWVEQLNMREEFLAGGGTEEEWISYFALLTEIYKITQQQVANKTYVSITIPAPIITIAEKY